MLEFNNVIMGLPDKYKKALLKHYEEWSGGFKPHEDYEGMEKLRQDPEDHFSAAKIPKEYYSAAMDFLEKAEEGLEEA